MSNTSIISRAFARFSFATLNKTKFTSHFLRDSYKVDFFRKTIFLEHREKRSEFRLGSAFFGISEVDFLPEGYRIKELWKKDVFSMENVKGP